MAKRTLTNEQILSRFGSIEAYDEHRMKVSIYRKKRRQNKKAELPYHPVKTSLLDKLGEPICSKTECTRLGAIILLVFATISIVSII